MEPSVSARDDRERSERLLRAHHAAASPSLRYSAVTPAHLEGWLAKEGKALRTRRTRFVRLNGRVLSSHRSKDASPSWHVSLAHAIVEKGAHPREIKLSLPHRVFSFLAPTQAAFEAWVVALRRASLVSSRVEDFYCVGRLVGEGMNGQVRLAQDLLTDEQVAVKMVPRLGRENETAFLAREVQIILSVAHPNIVRTVDVFVRSRRIHFVMEYLAGGELFDFIAENAHFTEAHATAVMVDLLRALSYLHARGIAHRDVKLENLLCANTTWPLHVKLADFGFANYVHNSDHLSLSSFVGTPYYIAPEMLRGNPHGCGVDVWASGVVLYILLSGKFPFGGKNESEYYQRVLTKEAYFPDEEWSTISDSAKALVRGMLCKDPKKRLTADECLRHPWMKRSSSYGDLYSDVELFPADSAPMSCRAALGVGHLSGPISSSVAGTEGDSESKGYWRSKREPDTAPLRYMPASRERQHILQSPHALRQNREKKGKWRYLGMLNHSVSAPTDVMLAARQDAERRAKDAVLVDSPTMRMPAPFDETMPNAPEDSTVNRRPSLIRRLITSGKLSLDRYDGRFPSFRGGLDESADEATATPRKTLSLFSKDGPLRRSFHRSGEPKVAEDGINFVNSQSQKLPPKIARERQRQQRQAEAMRKSARGGGIFSHRKANGSQFNPQSAGYHSSPRLQSPLAHPFSTVPAPAGQRGTGKHHSSIYNDLVNRNGPPSRHSYDETSHDVLVDQSGCDDTLLAQLSKSEDGDLRRTMSADITPLDRLSGEHFANSQILSGHLSQVH